MRDDTYEEDPLRSRDVPEESVYLNVVKVHHQLKNDLKGFFEDFDLTHRQYNVLRILYVRGESGLPCRALRDHLVTNVSDISRLIDRLQEKDLVKRDRSDEDRRVVLVRLTEEGERRCQSVDERLIDLHKKQLQHLDKETIEQLNDLLRSVLDRPNSVVGDGE